MNRRLPFELPAPRGYSSTPTAVRSRRHRERRRQAQLESRSARGDGPPTTSYFCICGWKYTGLGTLAATVGAFNVHAKGCLFGEPVQIIVRRRSAP